MYQDALQAVERAVELEDLLFNENNISLEHNKNLATAFINKATIMSELGLHLEAIETIKKALFNVEEYRKKFSETLSGEYQS
jgi:tetratricopeptide (TPR) repeat protein